jgi:8-hydroxy-5-deazaflavin:NADPH oxidoreductase
VSRDNACSWVTSEIDTCSTVGRSAGAVCEALDMRIGVLGGTGPAGKGVATRLGSVGHDVVVGSRDRDRARGIVDELVARWGERVSSLTAGTNEDAAAADVVVIGTVWDAAVPTATQLAASLDGKVVVSMANGLEKAGREFRPVMPPEGSIAAAIQAAAPGARVVAALQHVPAAPLGDLEEELSSDVLVAGDDDAARATVIELVDAIPGLHGLDAGGLVNAQGIEAFAAALLTVNLRHRGEATLRLVGVGERR